MPYPDQIFENLREAIREMTIWMKENPHVSPMDQIRLENHIQMLQMIYAAWKLRNPQRAVRD
jgi:hypothetical protein